MPLAGFHKKKKLSPVLKGTILLLFLFLLILIVVGIYQSSNTRITVFSPQLEPPVLPASGIYPEPFFVVLEGTGEDVKFYYTLDGSLPLPANGIRYDKPFEINKEEVFSGPAWISTSPRWKAPMQAVEKQPLLRAFTFKNDSVSRVATSHIFIGEKFPVVSIAAEPDSLFGFEKGLYVMGKKYEDKDNYARDEVPLTVKWWEYPANYHERGSDWQRQVSVYTSGTFLGEFQDDKAGLRIHGSATRAFPQKSLRLFFSDDKKIMPVVLRNGGNDWDRAFIRDVFCQEVYSGISKFSRRSHPVMVYLNGTFWGLHNLRDYQDHRYIAEILEADASEIVMLDVNLDLYRGEKVPGKLKGFLEKVARGKLSDDQKNFAFLKSHVDINDFIDYLIYNIYFANTDWPHNNFRVWTNTSEVQDSVKWHFLPTDHDFAAGYNGVEQAVKLNMLERTKQSNTFTGKLFNLLLQDSSFRDEFKTRFEYQLETVYSVPAQTAVLDSLHSLYKPFMARQINRWSTHSSVAEWENAVNEIRAFVKRRNSVQSQQIREFFGKFEE